MEQEKKILLKVDTGGSEKTVKSLKKDISDLKDAILNLEKGTKEYDDAVEQLQASQRELNEVQALTKQTAVALDGSYDALVHKMGLLKKEWRATNDEGRRNELGKQIAEINAQLKELDASTGNFQRNVGDYENQMTNAFQNITQEIKQYKAEVLAAEEGTEEWQAAMNRLATAQFQMREMNEKSRYAVADLGEQLNNLTGIASGVMGGFNALQGAMALCGNEGEDFQKVMVKLQAGMAIVQGLQGLEGVKDRVDGLASSLKVVMKSMGKGGWIGIILAVVTALALLAEKLTRTNRQMKNGVWLQKQWNSVQKESQKEVAEFSNTLLLYYKAATDETVAVEKRLKAAEQVLKILGIEATHYNKMIVYNKELDSAISHLIKTMEKQAVTLTIIDKMKEKYSEFLDVFLDSPSFWDKMTTWDISSWFDGDKQWWNDDDFGADKKAKRYAKIYKEYEALTKQAYEMLKENPDTEIIDYEAAAQQRIEGMQRTYEEMKAYALAEVKTEREKAEIEYKYESELTRKKIELIKVYQQQALDGGLLYSNQYFNLSHRIKDLEIENIQRLNDEKERLRNLDEEQAKRHFNVLTTETAQYYDAEEQRINNLLISNTEKDIQLLDNEKKRLDAEQVISEAYLNWLLENEEKNADEIIQVKDEMYRRGIAMLQTNIDKETVLRRQAFENVQKEIAKLDAEYQKQEVGFETDFIPAEEMRNFWETLFDIQLKKRAYEEEDFQEEQKYYERRNTYLEQIKAKQEELLTHTVDEDEQLAILQEIADTELAIEENKYDKLKAIRDKDFQDEERRQQGKVALLNATMAASSNILNSIADMYEADTEVTEEEEKKIKNLRIAAATIDMFQGAVSAYASAQSLGVPLGPIVGGINAAAVIAMGAANIAKIKSTQISTTGGGGTGGGGTAVTPPVQSYSSELPVNYTRNVTGASEIDEINKPTKVYVVESDITDAQAKAQVRNSESSF